MPAYRPPVDDILYTLRHAIDRDTILSLGPFSHLDAETLDAVVMEAGRFTSEVIAPLNEGFDREGATLANGAVTLPAGFVDAYGRFCEGGWPSLALPEQWGGQAMPEIAQGALSELLNGASVAFSMLPTTGRAASRVLLSHATEELRRLYLPKLVSGEWAATITMTEPHAGSDIGLARTKAVRNGDGTYAITGTKIFISFGDHDAAEQIVHIVLARTEGAPAGVRGLSLFLVPAFIPDEDGRPGPRNAVRAMRIEEKAGIHGSPTCEMQFDGAVGWLLGEELRGIQNMFTMINTMRLEVAYQGIGVAGAALGNALAYATERPQGTREGEAVPIIEHPDVRRNLMTMRALTDGGRALAYETAQWLDLANGADDASVRRDASVLAAFLLPICKATFTDNAVLVANIGIQVFGGHGYCRDHGAEQIWRDSRILPIYEGTNGIQAIDLLTRKLPRDDARAFHLFREAIAADLSRVAGDARVAELAPAVEETLALFEDATERLGGILQSRPDDALAGATPYLQLAGRLAIGWKWLRLATPEGDEPLAGEKQTLARFYARQILVDAPALARQSLDGAELLFELDSERLARI